MPFDTILFTLQVLGVFVTVFFILSVFLKRNDIADIAWGIGISLIALVSYYSAHQLSALHGVLILLALLWGVRLSARILLRTIKKSEDYRYKKWRDAWGKWFYPRSYMQVYLLQGMLMIVVGYPFIHASEFAHDTPVSAVQFIGIFVWCVGYFFEVVGDWQLDRFLKRLESAGMIMQNGLWKYSRHPNYFGEVTMWWGIWLLVAPLPFGYVALISPLTITFLILKVSGIPMLEKHFEGNVQFEAYKKCTSAFFPRSRKC
ncbi:MAG: DUF1295 domain-containing protein [Candidatus Pacebacteria bacterium]|nr:DUF1295 domain-containing protein [Candidatus Paceibacterota bacterium]